VHRPLASKLFWVQGIYYLFTGLWPLISVESFQAVTGRKTDHLTTGDENDHWLVMTVGVLVAADGLTFIVAAWRRSAAMEAVVLAVASAVGLIGIDVIYVRREVIPPIYLIDAAAEVALLIGWTIAAFHGARTRVNSL